MKKVFTPAFQDSDLNLHQNSNFIRILFSFFIITFSNLAFSQVVVTKAVDKTTADIGSPITYTLNINCPSTTGSCTNAVVTDPLPANIEYIGSSPATGNVQSITYNASNHTVTITMKSPLNGTTDQVQIIGAFKYGTFTGATADNIAYGGPNLTAPSNKVTTTATNGATPPTFIDQVQIIKSDAGQKNVSPGGGMVFQMIWFNESQSLAMNNFVYEDVLPANFILSNFNDISNPSGGSGVNYNLYYKTSSNSTYRLWPGSPFNMGTQIYHHVYELSLASGEQVSALKWEYLNPIPGGGSFFPWVSGQQWGYLYGTVSPTAVPNTDVVTNCITGSGQWSSGSNLNMVYNYYAGNTSACVTIPVSEPKLIVLTEKQLFPSKPGYLPGDDISYKIIYGQAGNSNMDIVDPIITDVLPAEIQFVNATIQEEWNEPFTLNGGSIPSGTPTTLTTNYNGTGQTLLRWNLSGKTIPKNTTGGGRVFSIIINAKVKTGVSTGLLKNKSYFSSTSSSPTTCINWEGWTGSGLESNYLKVKDVNDLNANGSTTDSLCTAFRNFNVIFPAGAGLESVKWVKGTCDTEYTRYPANGNTVPGGKADYLLKVKNLGNVAMKDVKIIDILPFVGDKGVIDLSARNTQWRPFLIAPVTVIPANTNVTVYYSTAQNPCRDELTPGIPTPCDTPNWSISLPTDVTTVQSLKFDFGNTILQPGDSLSLIWSMRAPIDAPTSGEIAWNSFGYVTNRADNNVALLPSEPIKVGIAVKPTSPAGFGNYVWKDENKNGLQDETSTSGINGVKVDLYWAKGASPNIATDSLVSFTLTNSKNGNPGFYQFTNLNPGNYYAVFHKPVNNCVVTLPNIASPSDSLDSDGVQFIIGTDTLAITAITPIVANKYDYTWDMGFAPKIVNCTPPAAVTAGSNTPVNSGSTINLSSTSTGGTSYSWTGPNGFTSTIQNPTIASATAPMAGIYTVTVLSSGTCTATATTIVVINTPCTVTNYTICAGESYTLTAQSGLTNYQWYLVSGTDTTAIAGANSSTYIANTIGKYIWKAKDAGLCDSKLCCPVIITSGNCYGSLGNYVWTDQNNNGQQDGTESPISGVKVYLYDATGTTKLDSALTDATGKYVFDSLLTGGYKVKFVAPAGTIAAKQNTGADVSDSDANKLGWSQVVNIDVTKLPTDTLRNNPQIDAGFVPVGSIGDYVFNDNDNSNTQTAGDTPIAGIKVYLLDAVTGAKLDSTVTNINGLYKFDSLVAGNYKVLFVAPTGASLITKDNGVDDTKDSDADSTGTTGIITVDTTKPVGDPVRDITSVDAGLAFKVDLRLTKAVVGDCKRKVGDIVAFEVIIKRQDLITTDVMATVKDSLSANFEFVSATSTEGTYNNTTGIWSGISLAKGDSAVLTVNARIKQGVAGLVCNDAWIQTMDKGDFDSIAGNKIETEDDFARACVSVPLAVCTARGEKAELTAPAGYTNYQWLKNGQVITSATGNTYMATTFGEYTVTVNNGSCPSTGCCPIYVEEFCDCPPTICVPFVIQKTKSKK